MKYRSLILQNQVAPVDTLQQGTTMLWVDTKGALWAQPHRGVPVQVNLVPAAGTNGQVLTIVGGVPTWV